VVNVPDLGRTPFGLGSGSASEITALIAAYNQQLDAAIRALRQAGLRLIDVDSFAALQAMTDHPEDFGFANVTEPGIPAGAAAGFLFWDGVHPTTRGHEIFADFALARLIDFYLPGQGRGTPAAQVNALKGRVRAVRP
jgi:phospholipase/lecithinase/hemolysin